MGNERIPQLSDGKDYLTWKKEVEIWKLGPKAKDKQQAPRLVGFMEGKAHEAAIQIAAAELGTTTGTVGIDNDIGKKLTFYNSILFISK